METTAKLRGLRMSPRKVRLLTDLIKGKNAQDALVQLSLKSKHASLPVKKLLDSAIANAEHNHSLDTNSLVIKNAFVDGGPVLKRFTPRAFGRASAIHKRTSHVTLVLEGEVDENAKSKKQVESIESHEGHNHDHQDEKSENAPKVTKKRTAKKKEE